jgi:hypothetical protein
MAVGARLAGKGNVPFMFGMSSVGSNDSIGQIAHSLIPMGLAVLNNQD